MPFPVFNTFDVTIPAGTPVAAPLVTSTAFNPMTVDRIEWLFPPGCNGVVGIKVGARSVQVLPGTAGAWIIRSGDSSGHNLADLPDMGDWSIIGYNTGSFPHTIHVVFICHVYTPSAPEVLILDGGRDILALGES